MNNDESIRKYRIKVNRNGWMANLQRWVTGREPNFVGYCPFFWSTWFCLFLSPFIGLGRMASFALKAAREAFQEDESVERKTFDTPSAQQIVALYSFIKESHSDILEGEGNVAGVYFYSCLHIERNTIEWANNTPKWFTFAPEAYKAIEAYNKIREEELAKSEARRLARQTRMQPYQDRILAIGTFLLKPSLFLSAAALAYFVISVILDFVAAISLAEVWGFILAAGQVLLWAAFVVLCVLTLIVVILGVIKAFKTKPVNSALMKANKLGIGFLNIFSFLKETIVMLYKKECPLIEWGDESGPIEKRESNKNES